MLPDRRGPPPRELLAHLHARVDPDRRYRIVEVCGGHTHAIHRFGINELLPPNVELLHGPGCPVCVVPAGRIDDAAALAQQQDVILVTFGDLLRVPGGQGSLLDARARGADVRTVYSPSDALALARSHPDRTVVFLAIGFETTAPATAVVLQQARREAIDNFAVLSDHVALIPALRALLDTPDLAVDGLLGPGHVSTVIGCEPYRFIARDHGLPVVVSGFEPLDILTAIAATIDQIADGRAEVENRYPRAVRWNGNPTALAAIDATLERRPSFAWRGLGDIPWSGYRPSAPFAAFDAERRFTLPGAQVPDHPACRCGDVLRGLTPPRACPAFGHACTPEHPIGACMVSPEGACAAVYRYAWDDGDAVARSAAVPAASGSSSTNRLPPSGRRS